MRNTSGPNVMYLLLYVDDMLMANTSISKVKKIKELQGDKFKMKELGLIRNIFKDGNMQNRSSRLLLVTQTQYVHKLLKMFGMVSAKSTSTSLASHFKLLTSCTPSTRDKE